MRTFSVHQPNFLPWLGFFQKMVDSDIFVYLDDVQYPIGRSYVMRSKIVIEKREEWLSLKVQSGQQGKGINQTKLANNNEWKSRLVLKTTERLGQYDCFGEVLPLLDCVEKSNHSTVAEMNLDLLKIVTDILDIRTPTFLCSTLSIRSSSDERIADIGRSLNCSNYLSGSGGKNYQQESTYSSKGIALSYLRLKDYNSIGIDPGKSIIQQIAQHGALKIRQALGVNV